MKLLFLKWGKLNQWLGCFKGKMCFFVKQNRVVEMAKIRVIGAWLMVMVLLLPSLAKIEHHHDDFVCKAQNEKHIHNQHETCYVCHFEFSLFSVPPTVLSVCKNDFPVLQMPVLLVVHFTDLSRFTFLLRGPPAVSFI